jgi:hypothetical protein
MSEKRKPEVIILLKILGKTYKTELFPKSLFVNDDLFRGVKRYRNRANGKWFPKGKKQYFTKWEVIDLIWRSIKF